MGDYKHNGRRIPPGLSEVVEVDRGGSAIVYRAHQDNFDRTVALKVLNVDMTNPRSQRRFRRECAAMGRLTGHPNIVSVFDSGLDDGEPWLVLEWMELGSLQRHLHDSMPVGEVLTVGTKIARALQFAHDNGVFHRDVKPHNILLSQHGEPKLADFGISALIGPEHALTGHDMTPVWAAPETFRSSELTPRADVYSLGLTLYALLAGRAPFAGSEEEAPQQTIDRISLESVPPLARDDVPPGLTSLLQKAVAKEPLDRPATARDFANELGAILRALGLDEVPIRVRPTDASPEGARPLDEPAQDTAVEPREPESEGWWREHFELRFPKEGPPAEPAPPEPRRPAIVPPQEPLEPRRVSGGATPLTGTTTIHISNQPDDPPSASPPPPPELPDRVPGPSRRTAYAIAALITLAVVIVVGFVVYRSGSHGSSSTADYAAEVPTNVKVSRIDGLQSASVTWTDNSNGRLPFLVVLSDARSNNALQVQAVQAGKTSTIVDLKSRPLALQCVTVLLAPTSGGTATFGSAINCDLLNAPASATATTIGAP